MDYKSKYLKYKNKYMKLKGGSSVSNISTPDINYVITNFHHRNFNLAMAEAIYPGQLSSIMTSHGLGTGIYGFINPIKRADSIYAEEGFIKTKFIFQKPIILSDKIINESDNTNESDLFSRFSTNLNLICYYIYSKFCLDKTIDEIDYIFTTNDEEINNYILDHYKSSNVKIEEKKTRYLSTKNIYLTLDIKISLLELLIQVIIPFIKDYITITQKNSGFILLPINYVLETLHYDGVYNIGGDIASKGSVKYFFDGCYSARSYLIKDIVKPSEKLIFRGNEI